MRRFKVVFRFDTRGHKKGEEFFTVTTNDHRLIKNLREDLPECSIFTDDNI